LKRRIIRKMRRKTPRKPRRRRRTKRKGKIQRRKMIGKRLKMKVVLVKKLPTLLKRHHINCLACSKSINTLMCKHSRKLKSYWENN